MKVVAGQLKVGKWVRMVGQLKVSKWVRMVVGQLKVGK